MVWGLIAGAALQGYGADQAAQQSVEATDLQNKLLSPFYRSGLQALGGLQAGANQVSISQLLSNPQYRQLIDEEMEDTGNYLGSIGASRSGFGQKQRADAGTNALLGVENLLNQRQQSLAGQSQTTSFQLGQQGAQTTGNISNILQSQGQSAIANALRQGNIQGQLSQNLANLGVAALDYYR